MTAPVLLHVPHASVEIPDPWRALFALSDDELQRELVVMTDRYTDELFVLEGTDRLEFPVSRLLVDPERFERDEDEPMAARGMGAVYARTHDGRPLKDVSQRERLMDAYYRPHHRALSDWAETALREHGRCLIVDGHSFPSRPLPCDLDQTPERPDFCVGTCAPHTQELLRDAAVGALGRHGESVQVDRPYAGTIVPLSHLGSDPRVSSVMIEVRRGLYMDEENGHRAGAFSDVADMLASVLCEVVERWSEGP